MARHPNTQQLSSWLNGEAGEPGHHEHIDSCSRCARRIEELSAADQTKVEAISDEFRPALMAVLQPPEDLHERISARIADRLQDRSDATLLSSLLGIPVETTQIVLDSNSDED